MTIKTQLQSVVDKVQQRWGSWLIPVFAALALLMALVALARLLFLSGTVELTSNQFGTQTQVWVIFIFNALFAIGFAGSAYGLWRRRGWGRVLFLWVIGAWSIFNLVAVLMTVDRYATSELIINLLRLIVGWLISLWYFNIPRIKTLFDPNSSDPLATEGYESP